MGMSADELVAKKLEDAQKEVEVNEVTTEVVETEDTSETPE